MKSSFSVQLMTARLVAATSCVATKMLLLDLPSRESEVSTPGWRIMLTMENEQQIVEWVNQQLQWNITKKLNISWSFADMSTKGNRWTNMPIRPLIDKGHFKARVITQVESLSLYMNFRYWLTYKGKNKEHLGIATRNRRASTYLKLAWYWCRWRELMEYLWCCETLLVTTVAKTRTTAAHTTYQQK